MGYDNHWLQYLVTPSLNFTGISNAMLTFKLYYAVEAPGGEPPPYDGWDGCNVWVSLNGGTTWQVVNPQFPAYNCQNLYSFGEEWGMGAGIAGWGGSSGGWVDAQFNLASLAGQSNVKFRFAFCSDPAWCTINDPNLYGMFVDNVLIQAGTTTLLSNNADGVALPGPFTFDGGGIAGDYWAMTTSSFHSATHSMQCQHAGHFNLQDALVSPWLTIPTGIVTKFQYWLWCDLPDFDGDGNNSLEDYYHVELSTNGSVWSEVFYDYGDTSRPGGWSVGWEQYVPGDPFNGNMEMDLSAWAGQQIKLRFRVITDNDNNGGIGTGLYIDDFELYTVPGLQHDVSAQNMWVPMPTSVYFDTVHCSVELHNLGLSNEPLVPAFWRVNFGSPTPLIPWAAIQPLQFVTKTFDWVTPTTGNYFMDSYTGLVSDLDHSNDTSKAGLVELTAANVLEFGYDNRQYSYEPSVYYFNFDPGEGAYVRYTPTADGVNFNMDGQQLRAYFQNAGQIRVHIYQAGTATQPGLEVTNWVASVTQIYPNWQTFSISTIAYLQNTHTDFWVWYETMTAGQAQIMGWNDIIHGEGHFFANFGSGLQPSLYDFFARARFAPDVTPTPPVDITLTPVSPPIVIPPGGGSFNFNATLTNTTTSPQACDAWIMMQLPSMAWYGPVLGPIPLTLPASATITRLRTQAIPGSAPAGLYTYRGYVGTYATSVKWDSSSFTFTKSTVPSDGGWVGDWNNSGESFTTGLTVVSVPDAYRLGAAYPNPFNPETTIEFALPQDGITQLAVYSVNGSLVKMLVNGWQAAGLHRVTFEASGLPSGLYLYKMTSGDFTSTQKMVLMK